MVRHTLTTLRPQVQATRMVREYVEGWYAPAARAAARSSADGYGPARELAAYRARPNEAWPNVQITGVDASCLPDTPQVCGPLTARPPAQPAGLDPKDVSVEAVIGRVGETDDLTDTITVQMEHVGAAEGMGERFESVVKLPHAGLTGYTVRVLPSHPLLASSAELAKIVLPGCRRSGFCGGRRMRSGAVAVTVVLLRRGGPDGDHRTVSAAARRRQRDPAAAGPVRAGVRGDHRRRPAGGGRPPRGARRRLPAQRAESALHPARLLRLPARGRRHGARDLALGPAGALREPVRADRGPGGGGEGGPGAVGRSHDG